MHRRFRTRTKQRTGIRIRTLLYAGTFCLGVLFAFSFFIVQFFREETSLAESSPMVISDIEVSQDTTPVFRGTSYQVMLRINIKTRGTNHKLNFNAIELSARGTSKEALPIIGNARLWSTGSSRNFSVSSQLGTTLKTIPEGNFSLAVSKQLQDGDNYFWITYDIAPDASKGNFVADAECIAIQIGTLKYDPSISAPPGSRTLLNNTPYFSTGNTDISSLASWNSSRDGSGTQPANFSLSPATFHIQAGHIMLNSVSACLPALLIEKNGVLKSGSDLKVNILEVQPGGLYVQEKPLISPETIKIFRIKDNANFIHANTGRIPGMRKMLEPNSTVILTSYSKQTFSETVSWGNLIVDSREATSVDFGNSLSNIKGDLEIRSTGKNEYLYTSVSDTINIKGNFTVNGGRIIFCPENNIVTLVIGNNFSLKKGRFVDKIAGKNNKGRLAFVTGKGTAIGAGEFHMTAAGSAIYFSKNYSTWMQLPEAIVTLPDIFMNEGKKLTVYGNLMGALPEGKTFTVTKRAEVNFESAVLKGNGTFVLEEGATMCTGHPDGINSTGPAGCIQTGKRLFHSGANYAFTGSSSPQYSGVFETTPIAETIHTLQIAKSSVTDIVILNQDFRIKGEIVRSKGSINKNTHLLINENSGEEVLVTPSKQQPGSYF